MTSPRNIARGLLLFGVGCIITCNGCGDQIPPNEMAGSVESQEDAMFALVSNETIYQVLKNVDRPFDAKLEKPIVHIQPGDTTIANAAVYCTFIENGKQVRRLFFVIFENDRSPEFPSTKDDLTCLLLNMDGKVLRRDEEYWSDLPVDFQRQAGAVETDGPPVLASTLQNFNDN